jgi:hypothetical protein
LGKPVKLNAVVDAMDLPELWESYLDPETGEIVSFSEDERYRLDEEEGEDAEDMPDWERESMARIRRVLDSGRALALPDKFDIHEWELMREFSSAVDNPDESDQLLRAIHGAGAFGRFRTTTNRLGLRERWFEYRSEALRRMAREWLEGNGVAYVEGTFERG